MPAMASETAGCGEAAQARRVRLRRSDLSRPGLTRRREADGFVYLDASGDPIRDPATVERIEALVIPPAWRDVWISPWSNGHVQACGTDAAGRRQYLYHEQWRERRDREKFDRTLEFARRLPAVRRAADAALAKRDLRRERVLACAIRLLDLGFFRVGGEAYADQHSTFGLATLLKRHVTLAEGGVIRFDYSGKANKERLLVVADPAVYAVVRGLKRRPGGGSDLLAYRNGDGRWRDVRSEDINAHLKELAGAEFSAKDFRTWNATVLASVALAVSVRAARTQTGSKRAIARAVREVSVYLGNTPAVSRASYIDPRVIERYQDGRTILPAIEAVGGAFDFEDAEVRERIEQAVIDLIAEESGGEYQRDDLLDLGVRGRPEGGGARRLGSVRRSGDD
jgi:DNA topoisomerase IB